jgi:D-lyxose ketol-isomerase
MKQSEINAARKAAQDCFARHDWALPPKPQWDITDFGLGDFRRCGLTLVTLANEPEYCEKLMFSLPRQITPAHTHGLKKEDIICRHGRLSFELWRGRPDAARKGESLDVPRNGERFTVRAGIPFEITAGERVTLVPGIFHSFWASSEDCIIGEVSTANDDVNDNIFADERIGRFPVVIQDE